MQILYQMIMSISVQQNRVLCCAGKYLFEYVQKAAQLKRGFYVKVDKEKILNCFLNSSVKAFIDIEKFYMVQPFLYTTKHELKSKYKFVVDDVVAKDIAHNILSDCNAHETLIAEGNSGLGLITLNLIKSDVSHVLVFDNSKMEDFSLSKLIKEYPNKITKKCLNMNNKPTEVILTTLDFSQEKGLPWKFFGMSTNFYFLRFLILTSILYKLWDTSLDIYLLLSSRCLNALKNGGRDLNLYFTTGFFLLFTVSEIAKYPRSAFLPHSECSEDMTLVRIKNKGDLHQITKKEDLPEFFFFVEVLAKRKTEFIIPILEKWLPDCGPYLIAKGISMTNKVRDLSPQETITLFKFFKECDGYESFKEVFLELDKQRK